MVEFEKININNIKPAEYNPRIMKPSEALKLKNNLETFGLVDPIIIDLTDNNTVIGGHQRLEALKEIDPDMNLKLLRLGDIGLIFRETELKIKDKNDQKALNLSLNKIQGEWDYQKLDDILLELNEDNYQIELTGFNTEDINLNELPDIELPLLDDTPKYEDGKKGALQENYEVPPFSVIDTTKGKFQEKTKEWKIKCGNLSETRNTKETGVFGDSIMLNINEGTSNFNPYLAEILCKWYAPRKPCWLDPFGGEQTKGVVAGELGIPYYAVEIRGDQVKVNKEHTKQYNEIHYYQGDSNKIEEIVPSDVEYNFCLTSPPYYDLEMYNEGMTDSTTYEEFMEQYKNIFTQVYTLLQENSFLILKLSEIRNKHGDYYGFIPDNINIMKGIGFKYYNEIILKNANGTAPLRANKSMQTRKTVRVHQNILIFYKGTHTSLKQEFKGGGNIPE